MVVIPAKSERKMHMMNWRREERYNVMFKVFMKMKQLLIGYLIYQQTMVTLLGMLVAVFSMVNASEWTIYSNPPLPRPSMNMAVGYYNQSIYILYAL